MNFKVFVLNMILPVYLSRSWLNTDESTLFWSKIHHMEVNTFCLGVMVDKWKTMKNSPCDCICLVWYQANEKENPSKNAFTELE
jgi:hypothetical protein